MTIQIDSRYIKNGAPSFMVIGREAAKAVRGVSPNKWMDTRLREMPGECLQLLERVVVYNYWAHGNCFASFIENAVQHLYAKPLSSVEKQRFYTILRVYIGVQYLIDCQVPTQPIQERPFLMTARITQPLQFDALHELLLGWKERSLEREKLADAAFYAGVLTPEKKEVACNSRSVIQGIAHVVSVAALRIKQSVYIAYDDERRLQGVLILRLNKPEATIDSMAINPDSIDLFGRGEKQIRGAGTALLTRALRDMQDVATKIDVLSLAEALPFYKKAGFILNPLCGDQEGERCVHLLIEKVAREALIRRKNPKVEHEENEPDYTAFMPPLRGTAELLRHARLRGFLAKTEAPSLAK